VRDGVKYVNKALLVVVGVRTDGYREILGATALFFTCQKTNILLI
jgi:transposase-like protein